MQYRRLGSRVTEDVSALGFGCMRFPTLDSRDQIDRSQADAMLRYAIDHGVNYVDTAWPYHGGKSESMVGEVLAGGYRDKVLLATKMPMWEVKTPADLDDFLDRQLANLQTDRIDFYLLHALNHRHWDIAREVDALQWGERMKEKGKIRYFGFSFHDEFSLFVEILDAGDWDFCQIQYNYMNETVQAGTAGLAYAGSKGIGVVVMEPLLGGALASPPEAVRDVFRAAGDAGPVEYALRWLWDKDDVGPVLSGMSTMEQVVENVAYASGPCAAQPAGCLSEAERAAFREVKRRYESLRPVPCTTCGYCMPCPHGVDIPGNFTILNDRHMYDQERMARMEYNKGMPEEKRASACVECGECLPKCPQQIEIVDALKRVRAELETA